MNTVWPSDLLHILALLIIKKVYVDFLTLFAVPEVLISNCLKHILEYLVFLDSRVFPAFELFILIISSFSNVLLTSMALCRP